MKKTDHVTPQPRSRTVNFVVVWMTGECCYVVFECSYLFGLRVSLFALVSPARRRDGTYTLAIVPDETRKKY